MLSLPVVISPRFPLELDSRITTSSTKASNMVEERMNIPKTKMHRVVKNLVEILPF